MFKSRIRFNDYRATRQIAERSVKIAFLSEATANTSAKLNNFKKV
jgi:hypothetical protein